jgi:hypothetical protein
VKDIVTINNNIKGSEESTAERPLILQGRNIEASLAPKKVMKKRK